MIAIRIICKTINPPAKDQTGIFNLFIETPPQQIYECNAVAEENAMRKYSRLHFTDTHSGRMINRLCALRRRFYPHSRNGTDVPSTHASGMEAARMRKKNKKPLRRKIVLRLPDQDHSKKAVLNSLSSVNSRRNYKFAMEQFISWYCSEPRLFLDRAVVLRFRLYLESLGLAAGTINQRLAAVRRLAYEAADSGLLSPELAAGIRRVKGVKQLGARAGNWLTLEQSQSLLEKSDGDSLRSSRDLAMI